MPREKCDRCGESYKYGECPYTIIEFKTQIDKISSETKYYNLCRDCVNSFKSFMGETSY
jgi:hypothetical protein